MSSFTNLVSLITVMLWSLASFRMDVAGWMLIDWWTLYPSYPVAPNTFWPHRHSSCREWSAWQCLSVSHQGKWARGLFNAGLMSRSCAMKSGSSWLIFFAPKESYRSSSCHPAKEREIQTDNATKLSYQKCPHWRSAWSNCFMYFTWQSMLKSTVHAVLISLGGFFYNPLLLGG